MKTKQKNLLIVILSVFFAISLLFGIGVKKAFAAFDSVLDSVSFTMQSGASVRKDEPTGLRFRSLLSKEDYNKLTENVGEEKDYASLTFGMLIAPQDYAEKKELNEANVFGENAVYTFDDTDSEKLKILNLYDNEMHETADGVMSFTGILTNVKSVNYNRKFVGVGYIKAVDKNGKAVYKFASANDNARSVIEVAQAAIEKGETDTDGVLADFTKYASLGGIVSSVENGDKTPQNAVDYKTGEISITATKDNLYINLNKEVISANGKGSDYVRFYLKSTNAATFQLLPRAKGSNDVTWGYFVRQLDPPGILQGEGVHTKYVDIPLNDTSVHDFSQYDLRFYVAGAGQNITIEKIEYVSLAQDLLKADSWDDYSANSEANKRVEDSANGKIILSGWEIGISSAYIQKAIEAGYTHLRFDYKLENSDYIQMQNGNSWQAYYKIYAAAVQTARFDLSSFKTESESGDSYAKIYMQGKDLNDAGDGYVAKTAATLTVTNPTLFKSTETASWNKDGRNSIYCAEEENGFIVLDTVSAGNNAHVLSSTGWWAKYANNAQTGGERTVILSGKYLYAGGNNRGAVFGGAGKGAGSVGEKANNEIVTDYMNNISYTDGNQFYYGLDSEGVYALKVNEFVSSRNSWGGFSFTYIKENQFKISTPPTGVFQLVNINTAEYLAKGYKYFTITVSGAKNPVWLLDGAGSSAIGFSGDQNWTKTIDLTSDFSNIANGNLVLQFGQGETDVIVTYDFFAQ